MASRTAVKTNERPGTKAQVRYARMSASKVRVVLDLIRGKHVGEASHILAFSERLAAQVIDKCLRSAVANAEHNDEIPAEELYVSACYADQGPTLKRFRPRARGRAGRIMKQTCHITVVVSRYSEDELDQMRERAEARGASTGGSGSADAAADRRARVAKSRAEQTDDTPEDDTVTESATTEVADDVATDTVNETSTTTEVAEDTVTEDTVDETTDAVADDATSSDERSDGASDAEETN